MLFTEFASRLAGLTVFPIFVAYIPMTIFGPYLWKRYGMTIESGLANVMLLYNLICSALSLYTTVGLSVALYNAERIYTNSENPQMTHYYQVYGFTKVLELMDTVFMILRNRGRQVTVLHVYHHSTMVVLVFYALEYSPWGALAPGLAINSAIHVVMYFYYGYTGYFGSKPTWKRRLTEAQMLQFLIDLVYCSVGIVYYDFCIWSVFYGMSMLFFFSNFYIKAYIYPSSNHRKSERNGNGTVEHTSGDGNPVNGGNARVKQH